MLGVVHNKMMMVIMIHLLLLHLCLQVADIEYILDNMPTAQQIADNGLKKSYMSQLGR